MRKRRDYEFNIEKTSNLSSTALFRGQRIKIPREPQSAPAEKVEEEEQKEGVEDFLEDTRKTILMLARIVIVSSVITTLAAAYLITRLTHTSLFPIILRRGK